MLGNERVPFGSESDPPNDPFSGFNPPTVEGKELPSGIPCPRKGAKPSAFGGPFKEPRPLFTYRNNIEHVQKLQRKAKLSCY